MRFLTAALSVVAMLLLAYNLPVVLFVSKPPMPPVVAMFGALILEGISLALQIEWRSYVLNKQYATKAITSKMLFNLVLLVIGAVVACSVPVCIFSSLSGGVPDSDGAYFMQEEPFHLNNHGHITVVSRERYLVNAVSSAFIWHGFMFLVAASTFFVAVFGSLPWPITRFTDDRSNADGNVRPTRRQRRY